MLTVSTLLLLAMLLPLGSFAGLMLLGRRGRRVAAIVATSLALGSLALALWALVLWVERPEFEQAHFAEAWTWRWLALPGAAFTPQANPLNPAAPLGLTVGILIDTLTVSLFIITTFITFLIHLFSSAFMPLTDRRFTRYFALLGLLSFGMLGLLLADSLVQMLIFWQINGLAAAGLIGLRMDHRGPAMASLRVLLAEQVSGAFFLGGLGILAFHLGLGGLLLVDSAGNAVLPTALSQALGVGPSEYLFATGAGAGIHWLTWAGLCFVLAAAVRSAQFPLHLWLAEASEAPAPAGALLTSCSAVGGVYLLARLYPLLTMDARLAAAILGGITVAVGGLMALVQTDLRKIIAWLAAAQLGYMVLFLGCGQYVWGLVHFFASATVLALLYLAAGAVLHALAPDPHAGHIRHLGGLWRKLPVTAATSLLAALALAGTPWLSGAYAREAGLAGVYDYAHALAGGGGEAGGAGGGSAGHPAMLLFWIPALATFLTALGVGRLWWLTFAGPSRDPKLTQGASEMALLTLPLILLAGFSLEATLSFLGLPRLMGKSLPPWAGSGMLPASDEALALVMLSTRWAMAAGVVLMVVFYGRGPGREGSTGAARSEQRGMAWGWLREQLFLQPLYQGLLSLLRALAAGVGALDAVLQWGVRRIAAGMRGLALRLERVERRLARGPVDGLVARIANVARKSRQSGQTLPDDGPSADPGGGPAGAS